jgi:pyrroline-5-carboxylate reductase
MVTNKIAFIGTGNMSYAIIGGMIKQGFQPEQIIATNRNTEKLNKVARDFSVQVTTDNLQAFKEADIIVLSVKPQMMADLCQSFQDADLNLNNKIFISVAAGISIHRLKEMLSNTARIVRCMPNTPSLLGHGVSGLFSQDISSKEHQFIDKIFSSIGITMWVDEEKQINDIIAVTGSSPAYFFLFMEAIENKAKALGFDDSQARALVQQVAFGSAAMVMSQKDISLSELRANVTSKGGTTHAAIEHFKEQNLHTIVDEAMNACIARAEQMEQEL